MKDRNVILLRIYYEKDQFFLLIVFMVVKRFVILQDKSQWKIWSMMMFIVIHMIGQLSTENRDAYINLTSFSRSNKCKWKIELPMNKMPEILFWDNVAEAITISSSFFNWIKTDVDYAQDTRRIINNKCCSLKRTISKYSSWYFSFISPQLFVRTNSYHLMIWHTNTQTCPNEIYRIGLSHHHRLHGVIKTIRCLVWLWYA